MWKENPEEKAALPRNLSNFRPTMPAKCLISLCGVLLLWVLPVAAVRAQQVNVVSLLSELCRQEGFVTRENHGSCNPRFIKENAIAVDLEQQYIQIWRYKFSSQGPAERITARVYNYGMNETLLAVTFSQVDYNKKVITAQSLRFYRYSSGSLQEVTRKVMPRPLRRAELSAPLKEHFDLEDNTRAYVEYVLPRYGHDIFAKLHPGHRNPGTYTAPYIARFFWNPEEGTFTR